MVGVLAEDEVHQRHRAQVAVQRQAERLVGQQPGRAGLVARGLRVPDGLGHLALQGDRLGHLR